MLSGQCHCGAVRFTFKTIPKWAVSCNCSICRRHGGLWIYETPENITLETTFDETISYAFGERSIAFHSCKTCGCPTHWENLKGPDHGKMAVNMNMVEPEQTEAIPIRRFDGAKSWQFLD